MEPVCYHLCECYVAFRQWTKQIWWKNMKRVTFLELLLGAPGRREIFLVPESLFLNSHERFPATENTSCVQVKKKKKNKYQMKYDNLMRYMKENVTSNIRSLWKAFLSEVTFCWEAFHHTLPLRILQMGTSQTNLNLPESSTCCSAHNW